MAATSDTLAALFVGCAHALLAISITRFVNRSFPVGPVSVKVSAGLLIFWASVVSWGLFFGAVGILTPAALYAAVAASAVVLWFLGAKSGDAVRTWSGTPVQSLTESHPLIAHTGITVLSAVFLAHLVVSGLCALPADWDSLAYHIPIVDHWIQYRHLYSPDCAFWYVPGNNELLAYWFVAPFSGDFWIALNNVPAVVLLAASTMSLGHELKLSASGQTATTAVVLLTQPVLRQVVSAENDVAVTALCFAALLFSWRWIGSRRNRDLLLYVLAIGLLTGVKYYALGYATVAVAAPCVWLLCQRECTRAWKIVIAAVVGFAALGSFWYVRNWAMAGTPLFPKGILGLPDLWSTMRPHSSSSSLVGTTREGAVLPQLVWSWALQTGPMTAIAAAGAPIVLTVLVCAGRVDRQARWWSATIVGTAAVYQVTPNVVETQVGSLNMLLSQYHPVRFGFTFLSASVLGGAIVLDRMQHISAGARLKSVRTALIRSAVGVGIAVQVIWHALPMFGVQSLHSMVGMRLYWSTLRESAPLECAAVLATAIPITTGVWIVFGMGVRARAACAIVALAAWCVASTLVSGRWHRDFGPHFVRLMETTDYALIAKHVKPSDRICVCDYRYYPFLGSRRQFSVCRPLWLVDREAFESFLRDERVNCVVTRYHDGGRGAYINTYKWMRGQPNRFEVQLEGSRLAMFRIREMGD